ncbi:MAG TPA: MFS transporter, partial [Anaerolineae bacterium]|nr:MFS transporter [Anaerolineae bacterium]
AAYIVRQYSTEALMVSLLTVIYAAAQFFAAPLLGKLSDRVGRRPVLLISILGSAAGYFLFGIGGALWVLFLSRLIDGFTGGNISTASAYLADVTPPEKRAKNFGLLGMAFGLGFILGPTLGGLLSQISLSAPAYAAGLASLISAIVGFFLLPESLPQDKRETAPLQLGELNPFPVIWEMLRRPIVGPLLLVMCVFLFVFDGRNSILTVFLIDKFGVQPTQLAALFATGGLVMAIVQGGLIGPLVKRYGEKQLGLSGLISQAIMSIGLYLAPAFWMLFPLNALTSGASGLIWPTLGALISNSVPQAELGKVNGVNTALGSLMSVCGPLWAGVMYDNVSSSAPFWMGAIILIVGCVMLLRLKIAAHADRPTYTQPIVES